MIRSFRLRKNKKGFTLAELLIVVAIIAVLVAIAIPVFASQLEKSRESSDFSDVRTAYTEVMHAALADDELATFNKTIMKRANGSYMAEVYPLKQKKDGWSTAVENMEIGGVPSEEWIGTPVKKGACTVSFNPDNNKVTIQWGTYGSGGGGFPDLTPDMMAGAITQGKFDYKPDPGDNGMRDIDSFGFFEDGIPCLGGRDGHHNVTLGEGKPNTVYKDIYGRYFQTDGRYWYQWNGSDSKWEVYWHPDADN